MTGLRLDSRFFDYNKKELALAFFVALITILVYLPSLENEYVNWDDPDYVYENRHIQSMDFKFFKWIFNFHASNWHPLTWLSHSIDYAIWGLNPMGHHLTNIIFHGLNTFLVVLIIICLVNYANPPLPPFSKVGLRGINKEGEYYTSIIAGAVTGILFGIHPVHVESVAWVSERKDVLYAFFFLLSILFYLKYTSSELREQKNLNYFLCLLFFILSLMSKPMAVTLPVVLLILDVYPLRRLSNPPLPPFTKGGTDGITKGRQGAIRVLMEKLPFIGLSIVSSVITIIAQQREILSFEVHLGGRFLIAFQSLIFYLFKMLWPTGLSPLYPYPSKISLLNIEYLGTFILVVCITIFCIWSWKRQKVFSAAWVYYVVTLLPVSGIIKVGEQAAADRYTYLPSLGPMLLVGLGVLWLWGKAATNQKRLTLTKASIIIVSILVISIISFLTVRQVGVWRDSMTLWNRELKLYSIPQAYNGRGNTYFMSDKYQQAIEDYNKAIELDPKYVKAYNNRGLSYGKLEKYQQAIEDFTAAINLNNRESRAYYNRGNVFKALGNYQKAIEDYNKAIELNPKKADAFNNRGNTYMKLNNFQKAVEDFNMANELDPKNDKVYLNRGIAYENLGKYEQAISDYQISARLGNKQVQDYLESKGIVW